MAKRFKNQLFIKYIVFFITALLSVLYYCDAKGAKKIITVVDLLSLLAPLEKGNSPSSAVSADNRSCTNISRLNACGLTKQERTDFGKKWVNATFEAPFDDPKSFSRVVVNKFGISEDKYREDFTRDIQFQLNVAIVYLRRKDPVLAELLSWINKIVFIFSVSPAFYMVSPGSATYVLRPDYPNGVIIIGLKQNFSIQELLQKLQNELFHVFTQKENRKKRIKEGKASFLTTPTAKKVYTAILAGDLNLKFLLNLYDQPSLSASEGKLLRLLELHLGDYPHYKFISKIPDRHHLMVLKKLDSSHLSQEKNGSLRVPSNFFPETFYLKEESILNEVRLRVEFEKVDSSTYEYSFLHHNESAPIAAKWLLGVLLRRMLYKNSAFFGMKKPDSSVANDKQYVASEQASDLFSMIPPGLRKALFSNALKILSPSFLPKENFPHKEVPLSHSFEL